MSLSSGLLPSSLSRAIAACGHTDLTPIQRAVADAPASARDLIVTAPTGAGKTVAVGIAIAMMLLAEGLRAIEGTGPAALVVAPTRDLAGQICGELRRFLAKFGLSVLCLTGGRGRALEQARLAEGPSVVVATPGRLRDHLRSGAFDPSGLRVVVFDEADDLVAGGFGADLRALLAGLPEGARRHLCSATLTREMSALSRRVQSTPLLLRAEAPKGRARTNRVRTIAVSRRGRDSMLARLIAENGALQTLIFCSRRAEVGRLSDWLGGLDYPVVALSGELSRIERRAALAAFRNGDASVCVATDLVSRGLVFPGLELVINAELPFSPQSLVHRCGRRALDGQAVLLVPHGRRGRAERMAERAGLILDWERAGRAGRADGRGAQAAAGPGVGASSTRRR